MSRAHDPVTCYRVIESPTGPFLLMETRGGVVHTTWAAHSSRLDTDARETPQLRPALAERLTAFFAGERVNFDDVPLPPGTTFQRKCWQAARTIEPGRVVSYATLATAAESPAAMRAAGQAMKRNPQPIITPCHRVINRSGGLGGFIGATGHARKELRTKVWLLEMEGHRIGQNGTIQRAKTDDQVHEIREIRKMP